MLESDYRVGPATDLSISGDLLVPLEEKINVFISNDYEGNPVYDSIIADTLFFLANLAITGVTQQGDGASGCAKWVTPNIQLTNQKVTIRTQAELLALPKGVTFVDTIASCDGHTTMPDVTINGCHSDGRIVIRKRSDISGVWSTLVHELGHYYGLPDLYGPDDGANFMFNTYSSNRKMLNQEQCAKFDLERS